MPGSLVTTNPSMYCRKCGYALTGLSEHRCPECGRPFDPADRRTFHSRQRFLSQHTWLRHLLIGLAIVVPVMTVAIGGVAGWLTYRFNRQQRIYDALRRINASVGTNRIFSWADYPWVRHNWLLSRYTYLLNTIDDVAIGPADITDDWLANLEGLRDLKRVRFFQTPHITDAGLKHLANLTALETLEFENVPITGSGLEHLQKLSRLHCLFLHYTRVTGPGLQYLKCFPQLTTLKLGRTPITDSDLAYLAHLPQLTDLSLWWTKIADDGLAHLAGIKHLGHLDLQDTAITDRGLQYFSGPLNGPCYLDLAGTHISDAGIACLKDKVFLRDLDLSNTQITMEGLKLLKSQNTLTLHIFHTQITAEDVQRLKASRPQLEILGP